MPNALKAPASDFGENRNSIAESNANSYYKQNPGKEGPSMSISGSDGMLSFNPNNLNKIPLN